MRLHLGDVIGHLLDDSILILRPESFRVFFLVQIRAFVIQTWLGLPNLNMKGKRRGFWSILVIGCFSIDDGNSSENVSVKMNSRFFNLCRVYSSLLIMASVGEFRWS